jgi:hypothetical protein
MEILHFEIIKRGNQKTIAYSIFLALIAGLIIALYIVSDSFSSFRKDLKIIDIVLVVLIAGLGYFTVKLLPYLIKTPYHKIGEIEITDNIITISDNSRKDFNISQLKKLKFTINGYDGQPITGAPQPFFDLLNKPTNSGMISVDGLKNYLEYIFEGNYFKYEFFIGKIIDYDLLIEKAKSWKANFQLEIIIMR